MKIMVLGLRGLPEVQGGIETHVEQLYPLLVQMGCKVNVIVRSPYVPRHIHMWRGISISRLWSPRLPGIEAFVHSVLGVIYAAVLRPDILHIHAVGPAIVTPLARFLRLNVVVTHHGPDYDREKWGGFAKWLLKKGEMFGMLYANKRIVISKLIKSLVYEKYGLDSIVIPNGVVIPEIPVTKDALEKFSLIEKRYILFVSRFVPEKRHLDLLEAFKAFDLPGWKLVLVGGVDRSDKYHLEILSLAEEIPGVVITDFQRGKSLQELYAHAGMFVLPSSHEGLPIALLEALSYGLPVIASDIPANLEIGLPRTNYFPLGNSKKLAVSMHELAIETKDDSQRELWRLWVGKRYQWQRVASCTYNLYKDLMSEVGSSVL